MKLFARTFFLFCLMVTASIVITPTQAQETQEQETAAQSQDQTETSEQAQTEVEANTQEQTQAETETNNTEQSVRIDDDLFVPSEEISEDAPVSFPVDI